MSAHILPLNIPEQKSYRELVSERKKAIAKANREKWERLLEVQIKQAKLPVPVRELRFAAEAVGWDTSGDRGANRGKGKLRTLLNRSRLSDWKFDFCWPDYGLVMEVEGAPGRGRHTSAKGFKEDCTKYNEAWMLGWSVLRVTGDQVGSGAAINLLIRAFQRLDRLREG